MKSLTLPQVIPSLSKYYHKIISIDTIKTHIQEMTTQMLKNTQIYKIMYHLRSKGYIISCKKDLFYIKSPQHTISEDQILEVWYWKLLYQHCRNDCHTQRYVGAVSALEIITGISYLGSEQIIIINQVKTSKEVICFDKLLNYKSYHDTHHQSMFNTTKKYTTTISLGGVKIKHAVIELAILEALYSPSRHQKAYITQLITKLLKKNKKNLNRSVFESIIKLSKFHSSFNRLYTISLGVDPNLAKQLQSLIKKYSYIMQL